MWLLLVLRLTCLPFVGITDLLEEAEEGYQGIRGSKRTEDEDGTEHITVRKKENNNAEQWIRCSEQISSKRKEVPWYLVTVCNYISSFLELLTQTLNALLILCAYSMKNLLH